MGRPVYPYELADPDFAWLLTHFQESHPAYIAVQDIGLPVVMVEMPVKTDSDFEAFAPQILSGTEDNTEGDADKG